MPLETILDRIMELNVILMGRSRNNMNLVRPLRESIPACATIEDTA